MGGGFEPPSENLLRCPEDRVTLQSVPSVVFDLIHKALPRARLARGLALGVAFVAAIAMVSLALPAHVAAETLDLTVFGYVTDTLAMPVQGAHVVIENLDTSITYTDVPDTDSDGQFMYDIPAAEWTQGDEIRVTATFGSWTGFTQEGAPDPAIPMVQIDVELSEAIPEFGSMIGASIAACLAGAVAIVMVGKPRKK